jgi:signal peptidase
LLIIVATPLVCLLIGLVLTISILGLSAYVITGGSMTGTIAKGSLAVARETPVACLQVGDIITFQPPDYPDLVTHRIVSVDGTHGQTVFKTKGDANQGDDPWEFTLDSTTQAKYMFSIPRLGYVLAALTLRAVRAGLLAVAGLMILGVSLSWLRKYKKERQAAEAPSGAEEAKG